MEAFYHWFRNGFGWYIDSKDGKSFTVVLHAFPSEIDTLSGNRRLEALCGRHSMEKNLRWENYCGRDFYPICTSCIDAAVARWKSESLARLAGERSRIESIP